MKEKYIKQVNSELAVSKKQKKEVIRDLNEVFTSALEHGETEQQVIERLGSPKDFADNIHEQLGIDCIARQRRKKLLHITIAAVIAVMSFFISFLIKALREEEQMQKNMTRPCAQAMCFHSGSRTRISQARWR